MKIAHAVTIAPHTNGLYITATELAREEARCGHDVRIIDTRPRQVAVAVTSGQDGSCLRFDQPVPNAPPEPGSLTAGVPVADTAWLREADLIVSHQGLDALELRGGLPPVPRIQMLHGAPDYSTGEDRNPVLWRYRRIAADPLYGAFITMWAEHLPAWEMIFGRGRVRLIESWIDLSRFNCRPTGYAFGGKRGEINIVCADAWRGGPYNPTNVLVAAMLFAQTHPGTRIHCYGLKREQKAVRAFFHVLNDQGGESLEASLRRLGETISRSRRSDVPLMQKAVESFCKRLPPGYLGECEGPIAHMADIYPEATMIITPKASCSRVMKEALACGCQVVAATGCRWTPYAADPNDPHAFAKAMNRAWQERSEETSRKNRETAILAFDVRRATLQFLDLAEAVVKEGANDGRQPGGEQLQHGVGGATVHGLGGHGP